MIGEAACTLRTMIFWLQTPGQGQCRGAESQFLKDTRTNVQIEWTRDGFRHEKNQYTQEKEKSKENCRPSWPDTNRDAQTSRKKSDTDDVGEDGDSWNERNHGNRGRVLGEHGLRNVSANQIFSTNGRDGEGEQKLALFNDLFHGFLTGCGKGVFRIATSPQGQAAC